MTQLTPTTLIRAGGRKNAVARVQLIPGSGTTITVNGKPAAEYFQDQSIYLQAILTAYEMVKTESQYDAHIQVSGGGLSAQAQASRLALCKAFVEIFPNMRSYFKKRGFFNP